MHSSSRGRGRSLGSQLSWFNVRPSWPMQRSWRLRKPRPQVLEHTDHSPRSQEGQGWVAQDREAKGRSSSGQSLEGRPWGSRHTTSLCCTPPPQVWEHGPHSLRVHSAPPTSRMALMDWRRPPLLLDTEAALLGLGAK